MYTLAMAYCGTGNNAAIRKLLHVAVSDVNDDVRRVAVTSLGFLMFRSPEQCPSVVSLLSESYNPNVRYGAAMALGIACAGAFSPDAGGTRVGAGRHLPSLVPPADPGRGLGCADLGWHPIL